MNKIILASLLFSTIAQAQDIVKLTNGAELDIQILSNSNLSISFSRGVEGAPPYYILKDEIAEIRYQNGTVEKPEHPVKTRDEYKYQLTSLFNAHALDKDKYALTSAFEGDDFRIIAVNGKGEFKKKGKLFDMRKIEFEETAYRKEGMAFLNMFIYYRSDDKRDYWEEYKLVLRVESHEQAAMLTHVFKQLRKNLKTRQ